MAMVLVMVSVLVLVMVLVMVLVTVLVMVLIMVLVMTKGRYRALRAAKRHILTSYEIFYQFICSGDRVFAEKHRANLVFRITNQQAIKDASLATGPGQD